MRVELSVGGCAVMHPLYNAQSCFGFGAAQPLYCLLEEGGECVCNGIRGAVSTDYFDVSLSINFQLNLDNISHLVSY